MLVAVVGAGIMGASLTLHLAANKMTVLLFDGASPGSGASGLSFASLSFLAAATPNFMQFSSEALNYHMDLARPIGLADSIRATGSLRWSTDPTQNKKLLRAANMAEGLGRTVEYLSRNDALKLEPNLNIAGAPDVIVRVPEEGWLDSVRFTKRVIDAAIATGLAHSVSEKCTRIEPLKQGAVVWTNRTCYLVDMVVLACGIGINSLLEDLACAPLVNEVPDELTRIPYFGPPIEHVVFANHIHFRANGPSLIVGNAGDPTSFCDSGLVIKSARENVGLVRRELKKPSFGESITARRGSRPTPKDGCPIVGRLPGQERIFVAVTHAGITLAPYVALLLTTEIAGDGSCDVLDPFRPERFTQPKGRNRTPRLQ
ncbi:NAD(P)/FAD-dependent oxidoreductase [Bradyrhizobium sacchari]|uniref:Glycine/D-amino acid oxidase-like deaminating enzyme n=1 Tax=Bradyrhizobium sacchari TaxID=1399419 RepID=A0A560IZU0_9BRAD|nr:FAD-binding oxidoreductase [Bradyrhizobium sacchari]TWB64533.1 glycine/D-amino acid oxidase-like deaminating enzyme [Bradyrhizobium sacchari]TWB80856.1 glycine/D-amino acid oxidase-like deaminating enzyme [Bradyrhizobium sacchari]